jgi:uncharacterized spore protein YtfJ
MSIQQYLQTIMERLQGTASVKTVYGDPIAAEGKTIIPVAKAAYCFGMGFGPFKKEIAQQSEGKEGGGMGGGIRVKPLGVLEITKEGTKFIPIGERRKLAGALLFGVLLGLAIANRQSSS